MNRIRITAVFYYTVYFFLDQVACGAGGGGDPGGRRLGAVPPGEGAGGLCVPPPSPRPRPEDRGPVRPHQGQAPGRQGRQGRREHPLCVCVPSDPVVPLPPPLPLTFFLFSTQLAGNARIIFEDM